MASFITTDEQLQLNRGCCFLVQAMIPGGFPFHQFNCSIGMFRAAFAFVVSTGIFFMAHTNLTVLTSIATFFL